MLQRTAPVLMIGFQLSSPKPGSRLAIQTFRITLLANGRSVSI